jgi:hypothetical protein
MATLKNINLMSKSKYNSITPSSEELYAVNLPEYLLTAISKAQNGYVKFGSGVIVQWGQITGGTVTVTFPTPFTTTNISVVGSTRAKADNWGQCNYNVTTTSFTLYKSASNNNQWIAIGY